MSHLDNHSNFKKNILLIVSGWIIIIAFILYFNHFIELQFEKYILKSTIDFSEESSFNINNDFSKKFTILSNIADKLSIEDLNNPKETIKNFDDILEKYNFSFLAIADLNGVTYVNNGDIIDVSDRDYFKSSIQGNNHISFLLNLRAGGEKNNVFSVPIYINNEVRGVLCASMFTEDFYKTLSLNTMGELGQSFLIDSNGNIVVSNRDVFSHLDTLNIFDELDNELNADKLKIIKNDISKLNNNYVKLNSNTSNYYFLYYSKIHFNDWWLVTAIDNDTLNDSYSPIINSIVGFNTIFLVIITVIFIVIFNKERTNYNNLRLTAYTDDITNGKNDIFLKNNISKFINKKDNFAFISLEIINMKNLINILGVNQSEFIIKRVYEEINNIISNEEIIVHSYLGEFKLILKYNDTLELEERLENIDFSNIHKLIKFKIGVYLIDNSNINFDNFYSCATIAKESASNSKYMIYNKEMYKKEIDKVQLERDIKSGIENKEFKSWFQPKYGKDGKTIIGSEALVRWYKYGSIISPYIFIPLCESTGLIKEIDELILEDVCLNLRKWIDQGKKVVPVSINLSRSYLDNPNFIDKLINYIHVYNIPKNLIEFEITESSLINNEAMLKNIVSLLHKKGFKVLLDDFGVGYSSIKAISDANFDVLKIDKSFIDGIGTEKWNDIIKFTINLANRLNMQVIAEGIETKDQYKFLLECNCDMFQGYYFNKPMSSNDFSNLI